MKLLFSDNNFKMLDNFRGEIIKHFNKLGYEIVIVVPQMEENKQLSKKYSFAKINYLNFNPNAISPIKDLKYLYSLFRIYLKEKPDYIFQYTIKPNIYGSICARILNLYSIIIITGLGYIFSGNSLRNKIGRLMYLLGMRCASRILCLNSNNYDFLIKNKFCSEKNLLLLKGGEGLDLNYYKGEPKQFLSPLRFLLIGRVLYDKGYSEFVEVAKNLKKRFPNVSFDLIGPLVPDSLMGVKECIVTEDVKRGYINYLGERSDIATILREDSVVIVLPSYHEGLSRILMEACAAACPCITTDIPGCKEMVKNEFNGFLASPRSARSLQECIDRFIKLPIDYKRRMSKNSLLKSRDFDIEQVKNVYQSIVDTK